MRIGVAGRYVNFVKLQRPFHEFRRHGNPLPKFGQEVSYRAAPDVGPKLLEDSLDGLSGRLLSRKRGPVIIAPLQVTPGVVQVPLCLGDPVAASFRGGPAQSARAGRISRANRSMVRKASARVSRSSSGTL